MSDRDARLAESLTALAPAGGGDWADVVTRSDAIGSAQHRRRLITIAIVFATFLICAGTTLAIGNQLFNWFSVSTPSGWFKVETAKSKAPATKGTLAYIAGRTLFQPHKRPQRLAFPLRAAFSNNLVVSSPDGRYVVYQTVRDHSRNKVVFTPTLYIHDTIARREKALARGTMSAAWSREGRIAYFKADRERYDGRTEYVGQVMVQTLEGTPTAWTRHAARYEVLAWARDELLVRVEWCLDYGCPWSPRAGTVYALTRGGQLRNLHLGSVLALSPDGRYALGPAYVEFENYSPLVRVVRIDSRKVVATLNANRMFRRALPGLRRSADHMMLDSASWRGSEIAASLNTGNQSVLAVFRLRGQRLVLESTFRVPVRRVPKTKYGPTFRIPYFAGPKNERIVVTVSGSGTEESDQSDQIGFLGFLVCSRTTHNCVLGQTFSYASLGSSGYVDVVRNLSRPLARSAGARSR